MIIDNFILLSILIPLVGSFLIALTGRWENVRESVTLITSCSLFGVVISAGSAVMAKEKITATLATIMPNITISFDVEPLGYLFACLASFLWIVTSIYSIGYMRGHHEKNQTRFYTCFALAIMGVMGLCFSSNLLTLFLFYEAITLCTYPLVTHSGTEEAKRAGRTYLGVLLATSMVFQLPAIIWTWVAAGTIDFTAGGVLNGHVSTGLGSILLLLFVFGVGKAALMPFHRWLPAAMVAPTPVSALLHAVAVVKAGVFSVLKIAIYIFGIDFLGLLEAHTWLIYAAGFTILIGSLVAMRQDNLKRRLAYSTISQLSYIVLGAMLATKAGILGGGMHMITHAFGKITLFFGAGAIMVASHKTEISQMKGIGRAMPWTLGAFLIGSLSIIGLPPFGGAWSKWFLCMGALDSGQLIMVAVLMISSILNVAYLIPIVVQGFFSELDVKEHHAHGEAPAFCVAAQVITAAGCLGLFLYPEPVYQLLKIIEM
ncbi:MAG: monovalent cation/H+ antiporter subunit D family protein [Alphaproteobacteria bacterium]|nr:monovalent cation/H+ antiporter subunit D family protein [Alphaproteobacteria bacterium]